MSFEEYLQELLKIAIRAGINYSEFWEMTLYEIEIVCDSYNQKQQEDFKTKIAMNYNLANLTSIFVNLRMNGKEIPTLQQTYPDLFEGEQEEAEDMSWQIYKEQFMDFANSHNKKWGEKIRNDN